LRFVQSAVTKHSNLIGDMRPITFGSQILQLNTKREHM
jgi:hypothetical protein